MWYVAIVQRYRESWFDRHFRYSVPFGFFIFALSIIANTYAGIYATEKASNPVTDIILSNTRAYSVDELFVYGVLALIAVVTFLCLHHPKRLPFVLHSFALFYFIRAIFVTLTHLGPYPSQIPLDFTNRLVTLLFGGNDLFFSGHTGAPFLLALIFWNDKKLRYIFLTWSVFFGIVVLMGHIHYTIDVLSAFFITYGIYHIALKFFPKERALFLSEQ